jgi:hypothetical protein
VKLQVEKDAIAAPRELLGKRRPLAREQPVADLESKDQTTEPVGERPGLGDGVDIQGD